MGGARCGRSLQQQSLPAHSCGLGPARMPFRAASDGIIGPQNDVQPLRGQGEAAAWGPAPAPGPQALPFGLIRHRCRMEGPEYLLCPWPAPHSPWNIPCAFLSPNLCADLSPHTESPPTRLYPSRSFPSVGLRRRTPSPSLPAQPRTACAALHTSTLSSDPLFSPDTALRGCGPSLAVYLGFHCGALRQAWPAPSRPRPPVNVRRTLVSRSARSV